MAFFAERFKIAWIVVVSILVLVMNDQIFLGLASLASLFPVFAIGLYSTHPTRIPAAANVFFSGNSPVMTKTTTCPRCPDFGWIPSWSLKWHGTDFAYKGKNRLFIVRDVSLWKWSTSVFSFQHDCYFSAFQWKAQAEFI